MHLLAATPRQVSDGNEPVDPQQSPADVIFLSVADTELAALSEARQTLGTEAPGLRLANLAWLAHPFAVDKYIDDTASKSRLVVARVLGGVSYWRYAVEQLAARLAEHGVAFAALPGDDKLDQELLALSTVAPADWHALWAYLVEGGPGNAGNFLRLSAHMVGKGGRPPEADPLLRAGLYWPGEVRADLTAIRGHWTDGDPVAALVFYRALLQGAGLHPINLMVRALLRRGLNPLPIFVASLKDPVSAATLETVFADVAPDIVLNATAFAVSSPDTSAGQAGTARTVLDAPGRPVLQIVLSGTSEEAWREAERGLSARDIAMNVALPEVDGRLLTRAISFKGEAYFDEATECAIAAYRGVGDRISFVADLAASWTNLARTPTADRKVALILANYPNKDGRLANGVGLDTPAATVGVLERLAAEGYGVADMPVDSAELMQAVLAGPTNWLSDRAVRQGGVKLSLEDYRSAYDALPWETRLALEERWGAPEEDPFCGSDGFALSVLEFGNVVVGVQPARGYNIDPEATYHSPDLIPPHNYLAFYFWLRRSFGAHAIVHMGKHGNLEWLPGKAVALSAECWPEVVLGPVPHVYPFIVNDPGEGTQAKRRAQAVIIDHLTPPLTRAESYGPMRDLEVLVDEYYQAAGVDSRRIAYLRREIVTMLDATGIGQDAGIGSGDNVDSRLQKLDAWLCELKESQIRDGLHIFGTAPEGRLARDLVVALARVPRGGGDGGDASLIRALADDFGFDFDPLDCDMAASWDGARPNALHSLSPDPWRSVGDSLERLELYAAAMVGGDVPPAGPASRAVLTKIETVIWPAVAASGAAEMDGLTAALNGF
ncbi:MAG: cobaltochelatase subunit CobN, partial [Pseudomonadota bacterium]